MTVKEVIALAAENVGRSELAEAVNATDGEPEGEVKTLLRCYNLVENEVALDYCPLKHEEYFLPSDGKIPFSLFTFSPVDVYSVKEPTGKSVSFELYPAHLSLPETTGRVKVMYAYAPDQKGIDDECAFSGRISARLLSFGVACEFCLALQMYSEAVLWEKRFHDALRAAEIARRKLSAKMSVRARRWV